MNQTFLNFRNLYKIWRKEFNINSSTFVLVFIQRGKKGLNKRIDRNNFLFSKISQFQKIGWYLMSVKDSFYSKFKAGENN